MTPRAQPARPGMLAVAAEISIERHLIGFDRRPQARRACDALDLPVETVADVAAHPNPAFRQGPAGADARVWVVLRSDPATFGGGSWRFSGEQETETGCRAPQDAGDAKGPARPSTAPA